MICYKYNTHIRNIVIFNFNKLVSVLDIDANTPESYDYKDSKCIYPSASHVVNGKLKTMGSRIRTVDSKGPKYGLPTYIDFNRCMQELHLVLH